jgi:hypothetical protein
MKHLLHTLFLLIPFTALSQEKKDSTKKMLIKVSGNIQVTNNGISPVPAFSLGKPAIMTVFTIKKGNVSFSPEFNYGIDGKPWSSNNWLRVQFPLKKLTFRTGINWSLFFKRTMVTENNQTFEVQRANKYLETEIAMFYKISEKTSLNFIWWHDNGIDIDAVRYGNFYSISASFNKILNSKTFNLDFRPNFFYLENAIPFEGTFISGIGIISYKNCPFNISVQGVQPIWVKPATDFNWNVGLNWGF